MLITSRNNEKIKNVSALQKDGSLRKELGLFVVEGPRMASEIPAERICELYVTEGYNGQMPAPGSYDTFFVSKDVMEKMSDTKNPQGILATVKAGVPLKADAFSGPVLILENIQDPGNLGTMFRTAEAAGFCGIIMNSGTVDPYSPKVVRSTMGGLLRIPFAILDIDTACAQLKRNGYKIYAAHLSGKKSFTEENYGLKTAFMIGNEGNGLTDEAAALADEYIRIPMEGSVESLNASVAASLLMYEHHRRNC